MQNESVELLKQAEATIRDKYISMRDGLKQAEVIEEDQYTKGMIRGLNFALSIINALIQENENSTFKGLR